MKKPRTTMPKWPAYIMAGAAVACAYPAVITSAPDPEEETYSARGNEPGWSVAIGGGWILYAGNYGETRITVPRPEPRPTFNGRRYETKRLTVDISYSRCNDDMSGHGYAHQVTVTADGTTVRGCGGARRPDWDV